MDRLALNELWQFLRELTGTLIGVFVGFWLAMRSDRMKQREDKVARQINTIDSILNEMDGTEATLGTPAANFEPQPGGAVEVELSIPFLSASAFDAAVHSGNLTLLPPPLQATLSLTYEHLRIARLLVDGIVTAQAKGLDVQEHSVYLQNQVGYLQAHSGMLRDEFATLRAALLKTRKSIQ